MASFRYLNLSSYFRPAPRSLKVGVEINRGAYGTVHVGELNGQPVAVKKIHRLLLEAASGERESWEKVVRDFEQECRLLENLKHPNIVGFSGAFYELESKEPILVMEWMKENLRDLLGREDRLSLDRQLVICLSIARALEFLHSRSPPTVHRDLNDKNVMLDVEGVVKVGDLGQSRLKEQSVDYFSTGQPGAVPFMPPEALSEKPHYTEKIDTFSLGVLMLEVTTGRYPSVKLAGIGLQPEVVRRRGDLSRLADDHPLKPFILECLKDDYKERPSATLVCCFLESQVKSTDTLKKIHSIPEDSKRNVQSDIADEEARRSGEETRRRYEEYRKIWKETERAREEERRRVQKERKRAAEQQRRDEEERRRAEEQQRRAEEQQRRAEEQQRRDEEDRRRDEELKKEGEKLKKEGSEAIIEVPESKPSKGDGLSLEKSSQEPKSDPSTMDTSGLAAMSDVPGSKPLKGDDLPLQSLSQEQTSGPSELVIPVVPGIRPLHRIPGDEKSKLVTGSKVIRSFEAMSLQPVIVISKRDISGSGTKSLEPKSDPSHSDTSKSDERELEERCWIPFGIKTLTVGNEGGSFLLQPEDTQIAKDHLIRLDIPANAVNTSVCKELSIRYAILVHGPFALLESYELASPVVYINFNPDHLSQSSKLELHLPHWASRKEDVLTAVAPHKVDKNDEYNFVLSAIKESPYASSVVIPISGHTSLFAEALRYDCQKSYLLLPFYNQLRTELRMFVTYSCRLWTEILKNKEELRELILDQHTPFESSNLKSCVKAKFSSQVHLVGPVKIKLEELQMKGRYNTGEELEDGVKHNFYPPSLVFRARYKEGMQQTSTQVEIQRTRRFNRVTTIANYPLTVWGTSPTVTVDPLPRPSQPDPDPEQALLGPKDVFEKYGWRDLTKDVKAMLKDERVVLLEKQYKLIDAGCRHEVAGLLRNGDYGNAANSLLAYFEKNHKGRDLLKFCQFLRDEVKEAGGGATLTAFANKLEKLVKPGKP